MTSWQRRHNYMYLFLCQQLCHPALIRITWHPDSEYTLSQPINQTNFSVGRRSGTIARSTRDSAVNCYQQAPCQTIDLETIRLWSLTFGATRRLRHYTRAYWLEPVHVFLAGPYIWNSLPWKL